MRLKLTLVRPSGATDDVIVTTDAAASIADAANTIARVDPRPDARTRPQDGLTLTATLPGHAEALSLPADAPAGEAWIGSGASVALTDAGVLASGRSNALAVLAESVHRFDPDARLYYLGNARSPLPGARQWEGVATTIDEVAALASDLSAAVADADTEGRIAVFVESIGDFLQSSADTAIVELTKAIKRSDHLLVAEAESSAWGSSWPLMGEVKNGRRGFLLQPDSVEGDILLKTALPRLNKAEFPAGRGMFIAKGKAARVQLPLAE